MLPALWLLCRKRRWSPRVAGVWSLYPTGWLGHTRPLQLKQVELMVYLWDLRSLILTTEGEVHQLKE